MEYTIQKLAKLAGVTTRTLRYYHEIGLLDPCRISSSGYRIYGSKEVDRLQQILLFRAMDLPLEDIRDLLKTEHFDPGKAMEAHRKNLLEKRDEIDRLLHTVDHTIAYYKGEIVMMDQEKFEGLKKQKLEENESKYGKEIREKYGEETVAASNKKFLKLTQEELETMGRLEEEFIGLLKELAETMDVQSPQGKAVYEKHRQWLMFTWPNYNPQAHAGLAEMYVADERFAKYYEEKAGMDVAFLLRDAIVAHAKP